jgi:hypothetical protein
MNGFHQQRDRDRRLQVASVGDVQYEEFPGRGCIRKAKKGLYSLTLDREKRIVI